MMKKIQTICIMLSTILVLCTTVGISKTTYAITNTDEGYDENRGLVYVRLVYTDASEQEHILKRGVGFFVGDGMTKEHVLTSKSQVTLTAEEQQVYAEQFAVEQQEFQNDLSIHATIDGNINIQLKVEYSNSDNLNLAVLSPNSTLGDITNLRLAVDQNWMDNSMEAYTIGYSDLASGNTAIVKNSGTVLQEEELNGYIYYKHDIVINENNIGGPLMNAEGEVIGMNLINSSGSYYSIESKEIISILTALGIGYSEPYEVDIKNLEDAILRYEETSFKGYTEESVNACNEAYEQAISERDKALKDTETGMNTKYSQSEIDAATAKLNINLDQLEVKEVPLKTAIIIFIAVGIVLIGTAIAITLLAVKVHLLKKELKVAKASNMSPEELLQRGGRITPNMNDDSKKNLPINRTLSEIVATETVDRGMQVHNTYSGSMQSIGTTPVGMAAPMETSVLNVVSMQDAYVSDTLSRCPTLIRRKTGEIIQITKSSFVLGKAGDQVDFFVGGNSNISRKHACIKRMQDGYYIQDLNSTNGTFVNRNKVSWNRDVKLVSGDVISLGDDEFEFNE